MKVNDITLMDDEKIIFSIKHHWFYLAQKIWHHIIVLCLCIYAIIFFVYVSIKNSFININIYGYSLNHKIWVLFYSIVIFIIFLISSFFIFYEIYIWSVKRLTLTNKRIIYTNRMSLFKQKTIILLFDKITSVSNHKSNFIDFIFSIGKIVIETPSSDEEDIIIDNVYKPELIQKLINEQIKPIKQIDNNTINNQINKNNDLNNDLNNNKQIEEIIH